MKYVNGHCETSLDDYIMVVEKFYRVPEPGELVVCLYKGNRTTLKVDQVIHDIRYMEPYIIIELNK